MMPLHKPFLRLNGKHETYESGRLSDLYDDFPPRLKVGVHEGGMRVWLEQCVNGLLDWWVYDIR